jgi:hypothetical protein
MDNSHKCLIFVLLAASLSFATAPIECETDLDCQQANEGNVCMDGICGYAQEPMENETADNCITDDFCFNLGYDYCGENGTCIPHPPLEDVVEEVDNCYTDQFCVGEGYDYCTFPDEETGTCEYEDPYGIYACTTDEYCQQNNLGNECMAGVCGYSQLPEEACFPIALALAGSLAAALFISKN